MHAHKAQWSATFYDSTTQSTPAGPHYTAPLHSPALDHDPVDLPGTAGGRGLAVTVTCTQYLHQLCVYKCEKQKIYLLAIGVIQAPEHWLKEVPRVDLGPAQVCYSIQIYTHIPAVPVNALVVAGCMHMDTWQLDHENMICILWHCMHNHDNVNIIKMTITVHKLAEHHMRVAVYSVYDFPPHASTSSTEMSSNGLCPSDHISNITIP